jgi:hypothetical protein
MPTEIAHTSDTSISTHSQDTHSFDSNSVPGLTALEVSKILEEVSGPLDNIPENTQITDFELERIPRTGTLNHCIEIRTQLCIFKALQYGYDDLQRLELKQSSEITCSNLK